MPMTHEGKGEIVTLEEAVELLSTQPANCQYEGHEDVFSEYRLGQYCIYCEGCGQRGPYTNSKLEAIQKWNKQQRVGGPVLPKIPTFTKAHLHAAVKTLYEGIDQDDEDTTVIVVLNDGDDGWRYVTAVSRDPEFNQLYIHVGPDPEADEADAVTKTSGPSKKHSLRDEELAGQIYTVDVYDRIVNAGKFEGQPRWTPYAWNVADHGGEDFACRDEVGNEISFIKIVPEDVTQYPELAHRSGVWYMRVFENDLGFVQGELVNGDEVDAEIAESEARNEIEE